MIYVYVFLPWCCIFVLWFCTFLAARYKLFPLRTWNPQPGKPCLVEAPYLPQASEDVFQNVRRRLVLADVPSSVVKGDDLGYITHQGIIYIIYIYINYINNMYTQVYTWGYICTYIFIYLFFQVSGSSPRPPGPGPGPGGQARGPALGAIVSPNELDLFTTNLSSS